MPMMKLKLAMQARVELLKEWRDGVMGVFACEGEKKTLVSIVDDDDDDDWGADINFAFIDSKMCRNYK